MWVEKAMKTVAEAGVFPRHTHILLMNRSELRRRMLSVTESFESAVRDSSTAAEQSQPQVQFLHAFAVKANPLEAVIAVARDSGLGAETASITEFLLAEKVFGKAGANKIVFDSPAKTLEELHYALQLPCHLNVDNFDEIERIVALSRGEIPSFDPITVKATVGIRINPQTVTETKNSALATGAKVSKFGVSIHDKGTKERIVDYVMRYHDVINLKMIHVHSGSQGLALDTMVAGVKTIVEEVADDPRIAPFIEVVDIGGGFPVDFSSDTETVSVKDYVHALRNGVPTLFSPTATAHTPRLIITEFGRAIAAKSGVLISRVEYVKQSGGRQIVLQHIGADLAVRTVWQPDKWPLRVFVYDGSGVKKEPAPTVEGQTAVLTDVGGPCCNAGCTLTREANLPLDVVPLRDLVVVHDVGGYYHSSFSLYNLRQMPACYMCDDEGHLTCIKRAQTPAETAQLFETDLS